MSQSHLCAYLYDYDQCGCDECCQYKLTTACYPPSPKFCGKDQILLFDAEQMKVEEHPRTPHKGAVSRDESAEG